MGGRRGGGRGVDGVSSDDGARKGLRERLMDRLMGGTGRRGGYEPVGQIQVRCLVVKR